MYYGIMGIEKIDFRTPLQREKDERNEKIYDEYMAIQQNPPDNVTKWSIWRALGEKHGLKPQGVRQIILKKMESSKL